MPPAWHASPFDRMSFHGRRGALGMAWPADGLREARAFEHIQSYNAQEAMLAASALVEAGKLPTAPCPEVGTNGGHTGISCTANGSTSEAKGCSHASVAQRVAPHLR